VRRRTFIGGAAAALLMGACRHVRPRPTPASLTLPPIGMGTYTFGDDPARRADEIAALRLGLELGTTHIDTAEMYGDGRAESLVGEAIVGRRARAVLASKVRPERASYEGTLVACRESLRRLGTDHLDLYLLHSRPNRFPLEETLRAFAELRRRGWVRAIGVSNFDTLAELDEAQRLLGDVPLVCDQVQYHLGARWAERVLLPACQARGLVLVGYSPFARLPEDGPGRAVLDEIAAAHVATVHRVVLAFLLRGGIRQIPRAARPEHVRDNAAARSLRLSPDELARLEAAFPAQPTSSE
jgi:diketogulonate reductase-like aldo/keto reductase